MRAVLAVLLPVLLVAGGAAATAAPHRSPTPPTAAAPPGLARVLPSAAAVAGRTVPLRRHDVAPRRTAGKAPHLTAADGTTVSVVPGTAGARRSTWQVTYDGFPTQARAAFQKAVDIWAGIVSSNVPIQVEAHFVSTPPGLLGYAGPTTSYRDSSIGDGRSFYPAALADALAGANVVAGGTARTDITARFSSSEPRVYYGTDGRPPAGYVDFTTIVLHELGHGLGFIGSGQVDRAGNGSVSSPPFVYDTHVVVGSTGTPVTSLPNRSPALGAALQSGDLAWSGGRGVRNNGGSRPVLFAPAPYQSGSSYSHLDEDEYPRGDPDSLMTPQLADQEVVREPGDVVRAMFADLGWRDSPVPVERTASSSRAGTADLVERRADGSVQLRRYDGSAISRPTLLGGIVRGAPAAVTRPSGWYEVFARGTDDALYTKRRSPSGSWTGWGKLGGVTLGGRPAAALRTGDELHVFVRGSDGALYHRASSSPGTWAAWERVGGVLHAESGAGATSTADGRVDVAVRGTDDVPYRTALTSRFSGYSAIRGQMAQSPTAAAPGGVLQVSVLGTNGVPYSWLPSTGFRSLGGLLGSEPTAANAARNARVDLFGTGTDGRLYLDTYDGSRWGGWHGLQ